MRFHRDEYNDKFKHTLQHLAREWYHGLDMYQFGNSWMNSLDISAGTSSIKVEISSIYMKGGESFLLIQILMILKDTSEMFREAAKQLGHCDDAVLNLLKATMPTRVVWHLIWT